MSRRTAPLRALSAPLHALAARGPATISPTAEYTGYVWARHGLGDPRLVRPTGTVARTVSDATFAVAERVAGSTLRQVLLARHRIIDHLLTDAIGEGRVGQVVELAAGMSPRGLDLVGRHPGLRYVEADLPAMAARKQAALDRVGTDRARHRVVAADVFGDGLSEVFGSLDPDRGVAVVTEGLLNYFPRADVEHLWSAVAEQGRRFPALVYLSDLHLDGTLGRLDELRAALLGTLVRGQVHLHWTRGSDVESALRSAGFQEAHLHRPDEYAGRVPGADAPRAGAVRIVEARTGLLREAVDGRVGEDAPADVDF